MTTLASDGPPTSINIGGVKYTFLHQGKTVPAKALSPDVVQRFSLTWDHCTWIGRIASNWKEGDPDENKYTTYPIMWTHHSADQLFITPAIASAIDAVTAEAADIQVSDIDRAEKKIIDYKGERIQVAPRPVHSQLAPAGYVAPKRKAVDHDDRDTDTKKQKTTDIEESSCSFFFGRMKSVKNVFSSSTQMSPEIKFKKCTATYVPPVDHAGKGAGPSSHKVQTATKVPSKHIGNAPMKTAPNAPKLPSKPVPLPASKTEDRVAPVKKAHTTDRSANPSDKTYAFVKGNHAKNIETIFKYLSESHDVPEETRALVSCMVEEAKKKSGENNHVFRMLNLPVDKWNLGGLKEAMVSQAPQAIIDAICAHSPGSLHRCRR
jgi:hypothetical protein